MCRRVSARKGSTAALVSFRTVIRRRCRELHCGRRGLHGRFRSIAKYPTNLPDTGAIGVSSFLCGGTGGITDVFKSRIRRVVRSLLVFTVGPRGRSELTRVLNFQRREGAGEEGARDGRSSRWGWFASCARWSQFEDKRLNVVKDGLPFVIDELPCFAPWYLIVRL